MGVTQNSSACISGVITPEGHKILTHGQQRELKSKGGAEVRAPASHQRGQGSNPGVDAICGLSLLLVVSFAPRGCSFCTPDFPASQKPSFPNSNSTRNGRRRTTLWTNFL